MSKCPCPFIEYIPTHPTELCALFTGSISLSRCNLDPILHIGTYVTIDHAGAKGSNVKMEMTVQVVPKKGKWPIDGPKKIM